MLYWQSSLGVTILEGISDIQIIGIDETRPPKLRKEPYIDLVFKLSHKAPPDWCRDFNDSLSKNFYTPRIHHNDGLYIQTWVRSIDEIVEHLQLLKNSVKECTERHIEKMQRISRAADGENKLLKDGGGEQGRLNAVIAGLDFEPVS
jgi:hypothetical protein